MAQKLTLYKPCKPFTTTQAWGILNLTYAPYGYTRHNGVDLAIDDDVQVEAMCDGTVTETGYNNSNGNYVRYRTDFVNAGGKDCFVEFTYLHASKVLVSKGDRVHTGTPLILAGNTGMSTGAHTHIGAVRQDTYGNRLDVNEADNTWNWTTALNTSYTADVWLLVKRLLAQLK